MSMRNAEWMQDAIRDMQYIRGMKGRIVTAMMKGDPSLSLRMTGRTLRMTVRGITGGKGL